MTKVGLEVKVADILSRKNVEYIDDFKRNERIFRCRDPKRSLTRQEKNTLTLYFTMIKFPMRLVFE